MDAAIPESAYVAVADASDFEGWRAAAARLFVGAPGLPHLAAFSPSDEPGRVMFRAAGVPVPTQLEVEDPLLGFLDHRKDIAFPLDRERALGLVRLTRFLVRLGRMDTALELPTLAGSLRIRGPGGRAATVLFWWPDAREGRWTEAVHHRLVRVAPLLGQALTRLGEAEARARAAVAALERLRAALERRQPRFAGHGERVGRYAEVVGRRLVDPRYGRPVRPADAALFRGVGRFHDLGKLHLDDALLQPERLGRRDLLEMQRHPLLAHAYLVGVPETAAWIPGVGAHHERWDGGGYPHGLAAEAIPLAGRVVAACDGFDAMVRPGRRDATPDEALRVLRAEAGKRFDPAIVEAFGDALEAGEIHLARARHAEETHRYEAACAHATDGLARAPLGALGLELLLVDARTRARRGDTSRALQDLDTAAAIDPRDPRVPLARAHLFHNLRTHEADARREIAAVLERDGGVHALQAQASALHLLANLERIADQRDAAVAHLREARRLLVMLGDVEREGHALETLGNVHLWSGDLERARRLFQRSELIKIQRGDHQGRAINIGNQGRLAFFEGRLTDARRLFERNLELSRDLEDARGLAVALSNLGLVCLHLRQFKRAGERYAEAVERTVDGNDWGLFHARSGLVQLALRRRKGVPGALAALREVVERLDLEHPRAVLRLLDALAADAGALALWGAHERLRACGAPTLYEQTVALVALAAKDGRSPEMDAAIQARGGDRFGWLLA